MIKSSAKDVFTWTVCGAVIAGSAAFAVMFVSDLRTDNPGVTTTLYQEMPSAALLIDAFVAAIAGVFGGAIGAVAEAVFSTRRRR